MRTYALAGPICCASQANSSYAVSSGHPDVTLARLRFDYFLLVAILNVHMTAFDLSTAYLRAQDQSWSVRPGVAAT